MNLKKHLYFLLAFLLVSFVLLQGCRKEQMLQSGGELRFSSDTLTFDTVFTAQGSFTRSLKIINPQNQKIKLSSVRLAAGNSSFFHINVDGFTGNEVKDIEIAGKDSIYVFATVKIDPTNVDNPYVVEDKLVATLNGKDFSIPMMAFGQNAHYIVDSVLSVSNERWGYDDNKPYVVISSALIETGKSLTIKPGTKIYMHANSRLFVLGKLTAKGTPADTIIFQGDRLDRSYFGYEDYPGEWGGIYFDSSSTGSELDWVVIKNAGNNLAGGGFPFAIEVFGKGGPVSQLSINHSRIETSLGFGVLFFNANVSMDNTLVHSTASQALAIQQGGKYSISNCSFINYMPLNVYHTDQITSIISNYYDISSSQRIMADLDIHLLNTMIYGSFDDELAVLQQEGTAYNVTFENCLLKSTRKTELFSVNTNFTGNTNIFNTYPEFVEPSKQNYRPKDDSPVKGKGKNRGSITDLDGEPTDGTTIGCYR